ncbi:isocitrate lyase/phosphoenolpyruvate mutase family protein [Janibacter melonis]|uniref:isocitrate lyase/phosphoenolpyruvate mutase family protein n=1 Tax=Janibacter melonis TaxID=262209 RepID=UPI00209471B7|nr:isocitrate lyase/phosphoenolpyruvate mutase family protein [Janibacter melonis]
MSDIQTKASELLRLHHTGETLVLPTVWDAWSARAAADAGFLGLSIGSHPRGQPGQQDGEGMTLGDALDGISRICASVDLPVTADVESGTARPPPSSSSASSQRAPSASTSRTPCTAKGRIREVAEHADYIGELRQAADAAGVELVINARTDALVHGTERFADPLAEAITRMQACEQAGARSLYPCACPTPPRCTRCSTP